MACNIIVLVLDHVRLSTGKLVVTIIDVNHMAPEFLKPWTRENPRYLIEMQEEQPTGAVVGAFTATDADSNIAGYAIDPPSPYFNIDNITGKLLVANPAVSVSRERTF